MSTRPLTTLGRRSISLPPVHMEMRGGTVVIKAGNILNLAHTFNRDYALGVPEIVSGAYVVGDGDLVTIT